MPLIREDMADIYVAVDGVPYGDSWNTAEGANLSSDSSKSRAGGMGDEHSLGGPSSRDDVTCTIRLDDVVIGWHATMEKKVIEDAPVKVSWRFKNRLKQPFGPTFSVTGTLKSAFLPNIDTSGNEQAFYSIIVDCDERMA